MTKYISYLLLFMSFIIGLVSCSEYEIILQSNEAALKLKGKVKLISIKSETETTSTRWVHDDAQAVKSYQISNPVRLNVS